jgi:hypothetical protein
MENEDRIAAGLQQLHEDLEKLRAAVEKNYAGAIDSTTRMWRRNIGVYLAVVAAFVLWSLLTYHRW